MSPQEAIAALDAGLAQNGETIRLLRLATPATGSLAAEVTTMAIMRGYAPSQLIPGSGINQQDQLLIMSPSAIIAGNWPAAGQSPVPRQGDRIVSNRGGLTVQAASGIYVQDTLVRIEAQVRGA